MNIYPSHKRLMLISQQPSSSYSSEYDIDINNQNDSIRDETNNLNTSDKKSKPSRIRYGWEVMYRALLDYGKQHNHYNVPRRYSCSIPVPSNLDQQNQHSSNVAHLGSWLTTQRIEKAHGKLKPERYTLLQDLCDQGLFDWSPPNALKESDTNWPYMYECLVDYCESKKRESKDSEIGAIPEKTRWVHPKTKEEVGLGRWMHTQFKRIRENKLRPDRLEKMQKLVDAGTFRWPQTRTGSQFRNSSIPQLRLDMFPLYDATHQQGTLSNNSIPTQHESLGQTSILRFDPLLPALPLSNTSMPSTAIPTSYQRQSQQHMNNQSTALYDDQTSNLYSASEIHPTSQDRYLYPITYNVHPEYMLPSIEQDETQEHQPNSSPTYHTSSDQLASQYQAYIRHINSVNIPISRDGENHRERLPESYNTNNGNHVRGTYARHMHDTIYMRNPENINYISTSANEESEQLNANNNDNQSNHNPSPYEDVLFSALDAPSLGKRSSSGRISIENGKDELSENHSFEGILGLKKSRYEV